jgi:hypothetical protein
MAHIIEDDGKQVGRIGSYAPDIVIKDMIQTITGYGFSNRKGNGCSPTT